MKVTYDMVCDKLALMRTKKGISAQKLGLDMGVSHSYFNGVETRKANMTVKKLLDACEQLKIDPVDLFIVDNTDDSLLEKVLLEVNRLDNAKLEKVLEYISFINASQKN